MTFPELLSELMEGRFRSTRQLAAAVETSPVGEPMSHTTVYRALRGEFVPGPERIKALAWALGKSGKERSEILDRLRAAAGLSAQEPPPLTWPAGVRKLSAHQRRTLQKLVNVTVAGFLGEDEEQVPADDGGHLTFVADELESTVPSAVEPPGEERGAGEVRRLKSP